MKRIQNQRRCFIMKMNFNSEQLKGLGNVGLKIGKKILVEGTKAVVLNGAQAIILTSFENGVGGIKDLKLDEILNGKKKLAKTVFKKTEKEVVEVTVEDAEVTQ